MSAPIVLDNGVLTIRVSRQGGAVLDGFTADGRPFLRPYEGSAGDFDVKRAGCFPLVPIGNRVQGNAFDFGDKAYRFEPNADEPFYIHGDGWLGEWAVESLAGGPPEKGKRSRKLTLSFVQARPAKSPYAYRAVETVAITDSTLTLSLSVQNLGDEPLPFGIGFHPFFPRTGDVEVQARADEWWSEGPGHLPVQREPIPAEADFSVKRRLPERWLNNCYEGWNGGAHIVWPETALSVDIAASDVFSRLMLYAPDTDTTFFCLEPMNHAPNALAKAEPLGLRILTPGETLAGSFSMTVSDRSTSNG